MSDDPGRRSSDDEFDSYSLEGTDQLQPEDSLLGTGDPLDDGYTPPDKLVGVGSWGTSIEEEAGQETIHQRIRQEEPDPDSAYGAPDNNESGLNDPMVGGDDPDAIPADQDFLGSEGASVGTLVAPDQGDGLDDESEAIARVEGSLHNVSPEESAMHLVDPDADDDYED